MNRIAAALACTSLALGACSSTPAQPSRSELEAVATRLEADTEAMDGVRDVTVSIGDGALPESLGIVPSFGVTIVAPGFERAARGELGLALARRIWESELSDVATVVIIFDDGPSTVDQYLDEFTDLVDGGILTPGDMEELFGPRPD